MNVRAWSRVIGKGASSASIAGRLPAEAAPQLGAGDCFRARYQRLLGDGFRDDVAQNATAAVLASVGDNVEEHQSRGTFGRFLSTFSREPAVRGAYICGGVGSGKTVLATTLFECIPPSVPKEAHHFQSFMLDVHARLHSKRGDAKKVLQVAVDIAHSTRFLMLDEVQVTDVADALVVYSLFDHLFNQGVTLLATSNRTPEKLYENGLNYECFAPVVPLIRKHCKVHEMDATNDYRLLNKKSQKRTVYFVDANGGATGLQEAFDELADGFPVRGASASVGFNRSLDVPMAVADKGICYFTFGQLCEAPLSKADYAALFRHYHTVFLANVPQVDPIMNRNVSRRVCWLIDLAYMSGAKVIMNAAVGLDELFIQPPAENVTEEAFESRRIVSRMKEMQTEKYLEKKWDPAMLHELHH